MNRRILVFLDLVDLFERMHFDQITFDYLKIIFTNEVKLGNFPMNWIKYKKIKNNKHLRKIISNYCLKAK
jgi:hypothetical protein